jgi:RND family efflux transporter MFP subunit
MSAHLRNLLLLAVGLVMTHSTLAVTPGPTVATGVVMAARVVNIATKRPERIVRVEVERGDRVEAGALLIETDAAELLADRAAADAELGAAKVERDYRGRVADRLERLAKSESTSRDRLDEARYSLAAAEQRIKLAEAQVQKIDALLAETRLTAPFAGIVTERHAEPGQLTQPGEALLRLEDQARLELHTRVKELDIARVRAGTPVQVRVDALGDAPLSGTVEAVIPSGDRDHTFLVEILLPNQPGLYPGMFGKAVFGE